jgi:hypothetical protein
MYGILEDFSVHLWLLLLLCITMYRRLEEYKFVFVAWFLGYLIWRLYRGDVPCRKNASYVTSLEQKCLIFLYKRRASPHKLSHGVLSPSPHGNVPSPRLLLIISVTWECPITRVVISH